MVHTGLAMAPWLDHGDTRLGEVLQQQWDSVLMAVSCNVV